MDLKKLVEELAAERLALAGWIEEVSKKERKMRGTFEGMACETTLEEMREVEGRVNELEKQVREMAVVTYNVSGRKALPPGIGIRCGMALSYDLADALKWARKHFRNALSLNKREFEKAAKVMAPEFVTFTEKYTATMARDLPAAIAKAAKEAEDV